MRGSIRQRPTGGWRLTVDTGIDAATGKRKQKTETVPGTRRDAERRLTAMLAEADRGTLSHSGRLRLDEWLAEWLQGVTQVSRKGEPLAATTASRYSLAVRQLSASTIGRTRLADLRVGHVRRLRDELLASGRMAPQTVADTMRILSQALNGAVAEGLLPTNYASGQLVNRPVGKPAPFVVVTPELAQAMLAAAEGEDPWDAVAALGLGAGLRREEMLGLRWDAVDLDGGTVAVLRTLTYANRTLHFREAPKTAAGRRTVDLPGFVVAALRRHRAAQAARRLLAGEVWQDTGLVVDRGDGGPWEPTRLSKCWKAFAKTHGFGDVGLHGLRHGFATLGLAAGLRAEVMAEVMGHSSTRLLARYQDVIPRLKRDAADQFDRLLGAGPGSVTSP